MSQHRLSHDTSSEFRVKNIIRRVLESEDITARHSKRKAWSDKMLVAVYSHLENAPSSSHKQGQGLEEHHRSPYYFQHKYTVPEGWEREKWYSYMDTLATYKL